MDPLSGLCVAPLVSALPDRRPASRARLPGAVKRAGRLSRVQPRPYCRLSQGSLDVSRALPLLAACNSFTDAIVFGPLMVLILGGSVGETELANMLR